MGDKVDNKNLMLFGKSLVQDALIRLNDNSDKISMYSKLLIEQVNIELPLIQVVVIVPKHETVINVFDEIGKWGKDLDVEVFAISEKMKVGSNLSKLVEGAQLIISTPNSASKFITQGLFQLKHCMYLIVDGIDKLASQDLESFLEESLTVLPKECKLVSFYESFQQSVKTFALKYLDDPYEVDLMQVCKF